MTARVTSLTVHKSQRARRHAKNMAYNARGDVAEIHQRLGTSFSGYVLVGWSDKGNAIAFWDGASALPDIRGLSEFTKITIDRAVHIKDARRHVFDPPDDERA